MRLCVPEELVRQMTLTGPLVQPGDFLNFQFLKQVLGMNPQEKSLGVVPSQDYRLVSAQVHGNIVIALFDAWNRSKVKVPLSDLHKFCQRFSQCPSLAENICQSKAEDFAALINFTGWVH